jgi:hypothetical protein
MSAYEKSLCWLETAAGKMPRAKLFGAKLLSAKLLHQVALSTGTTRSGASRPQTGAAAADAESAVCPENS